MGYADEATDRWGSYDYTGGFTYPTDGKTDGGVAGASQDNYGVGENHFNGLYCCMCEERRRNGVIYSVCTGCKQTDACLALWRRNQRFTLPFMNFGDMSIEHSDGKPIYVD